MMVIAAGPEGALESAGMGTRLVLVGGLVLANAFFVAAEFALVGVRRSRIDELVESGDRGARVVQGALSNLDRYISATQLGITLASLALGWIGEPALATLVDRVFVAIGIQAPSEVAHSAAAIAIGFLIITFLHIVIGELAPKSLALTKPESVSKLVARPLIVFSALVAPIVWALNGTARFLLGMMGVTPTAERDRVHSTDELRLLVEQTTEHGGLNQSDSEMIAGVFGFHDKKARDVMRPRIDIIALPISASDDEVWQTVRSERYSRYPIYRESLDDVVGVFLAKDLWLHDDNKPFVLADYVRPAPYVPDNRAAERVLEDLRKKRAHMAIVLDEFGGTAGIITLEDLIEEVIGDINDEYDFATRYAMEANGVLELSGALSLVDVRSEYELDIPDGDWNTLGGFVFGELGRLAKMGDRVRFPGGELEVVAMDGRRVAAVRVLTAADAKRAKAEPPTTAKAPTFLDREVPL